MLLIAIVALVCVELIIAVGEYSAALFVYRQCQKMRGQVAKLKASIAELEEARSAAEAAPPASVDEPALTDRELRNLAVLEQTYAAVDEEIGPQLGRFMADGMRSRDLGPDVLLGRVVMGVLDGLHHAGGVDAVLLTEPGYQATVAVISHAVLDLTSFYRAAV